MAERWTLNRAGIVNVYQYGDEVLRFGGGRLLLRGVNGSGKSTAMNMLLPFLLTADVRRIDAAGEQANVLKAWMLNGRDEAQPTGYLWVEVVRGGQHVTFGCGIKANRSADTVSHWWFLTDRRPGVDLELVRTIGRARTPLGAEDLRHELGAHQVWSKDQRPAYRTAVRDRLFGGADLDQHLRLLHIVRNPRVGDRVDVDLPVHLHDALPQLSEAAIDDAATPLEQLEEHRRNVAQLVDTTAALDALLATYASHARGELHRRSGEATDRAARHRQAESGRRRATRARDDAEAEAGRLRDEVRRLDAETTKLDGEVRQLEASELYTAASDLDQRRQGVAAAASRADEARADAVSRRDEAGAALRSVTDEQAATADADRKVADALDAVAAVAAEAGLDAEVPARPEVATAPLAVGDQVAGVPAGPLDSTAATAGLGRIRAAARSRRAEVAEAVALLDAIDEAERRVSTGADRLVDATERRDRAAEAEQGAADALSDALTSWTDTTRTWTAALHGHRAAAGLDALALPSLDGPLPDLDAVVVVHADRQAAVEATRDAHQGAAARIEARLLGERTGRDDARERVAELAARTVPDPPAAPWQTTRRTPCLAELVDFVDDVGPDERAGLEAALDASGLLAAEVRGDGALVAGDLVVGAGPSAVAPLGRWLTVVVPAEHAATVDAAAVAAVLAAITTDPDDRSPAALVATTGEFRVGPLRGRHHKEAAEHIGVTARRAALERMRADARATLDRADAVVAASEAELSVARQRTAAADGLRRDLPAPGPVRDASTVADERRRQRAEADADHDAATAVLRSAETAHGEAVDRAERGCRERRLPSDRPGLVAVGRACRDVPGRADAAGTALDALVAAGRRWSGAGERWGQAQRSADELADRARRLTDAHRTAAHELAALEDAIGLPVEDLMRTLEATRGELGQTVDALTTTRDAQGPAEADAGARRVAAEHAADEVSVEAQRCRAELARLRAAVAVPGLLAAARDRPDEADDASAGWPELPVPEDSPAGLRVLAEAVRATVASPADTVTADGVRQALRQRRATLGAGWDADSRHPDPDLPLAVEVNGPLGRMALADAADAARRSLRTNQGLLTAEQDQALRNLLQGLIAKEVAEKLHAARELVERMNARLGAIRTIHGIGVSLRWRTRDDLGDDEATLVALLAKAADLRTPDEDAALVAALATRIDDARRAQPESDYRTLVASVLDYRAWHRMQVVVHRPGAPDAVLGRRTPLSEGEKKIVSYQPLFAAVAASCDALREQAPDAPRFVLLDDAFAKVSEDNHPKLFGLLVELDLDFVATSERLTGTHATVPELAITEVVRDAEAGVIVLEHAHWDGRTRTEVP